MRRESAATVESEKGTRVYRDAKLIRRARHDPAAMTKLLLKYRRFFIFILKRTLPRHRRPPVGEYLGEMAMTFMRCVHLWEPYHQFTTYLGESLRSVINRQRSAERLIRSKGQPYAACPLAAKSYKWEPVRAPPSDRRWNQEEHVTVAREPAVLPEWYSSELLDLWLQLLPPRTTYIIRRRLAGATYNAIGREIGVTRERVRQIERPGIRTLQQYVLAIESGVRPRSYSYWRKLASDCVASDAPERKWELGYMQELDLAAERIMCEAGTGLREHPAGYGKLYADGGVELTTEEAYDTLLDGKQVEVPNAGAHTFRQFFKDVGYDAVDVVEWSSSAGDWTFMVRDGEGWFLAFQSNRYPRHGFAYSVNYELPFASKDELIQFASQD